MAKKPTTDKGVARPFRGAGLRSLAAGESVRFSDQSLVDAVFSGGYFIVLVDENTSPAILRTTTAQTTRNRKREEVLRLANLVREATSSDLPKSLKSGSLDQTSLPETQGIGAPQRERLIADLQTLIAISNYNNTDFDRHLAHELDVARKQVLSGGGIDDYALMQTMQEIASIQGFSMAGTSMRGRFTSDIFNAAEPEQAPAAIAAPEASATAAKADSPENLKDYEQFYAYFISDIGGEKHHPSYFFAKKIIDSILANDAVKEQEQDSSTLATPLP